MRLSGRAVGFILSVIPGLVVSVGCERRTPQCNRFVDIINENQRKMADVLKFAGGPAPTQESLETYAKANDVIVVELRKLKLKDVRLEGFRDRYIELSQGLAAGVRKTASKLGTFPEDAQKAAEEVKAFSPKKHDLEKSINEFCRGKDD